MNNSHQASGRCVRVKALHLESLARVAHSQGQKFSSLFEDRVSPSSAQQFWWTSLEGQHKTRDVREVTIIPWVQGIGGGLSLALLWRHFQSHPGAWRRDKRPVLKKQVCFLTTV